MSTNDVQSLRPLNDSVVPLELGDDMDKLLNIDFVLDVDTTIDSNVNIVIEGVNFFEGDVHVESMNDDR